MTVQTGRKPVATVKSGKNTAAVVSSVHPLISAAIKARNTGDWENAARGYHQYLEYQPSDRVIWIELARAYVELADVDRAREAYEYADFLDPRDPDLLLCLGHIYYQLGITDKAATTFERRQKLSFDAEVEELVNSLKLNLATMTGSIDKIEAGVLHGWVKSLDYDEPIEIDLYANGRLVSGSYLANQFRPDLEQAGIGNGRHGFAIPLHELQLPAGAINFSIHVAGNWIAELDTTLHGRCDGRIDLMTADRIAGWAVNAANPQALFDIDVMINGEYFRSIRNDGVRNDLKAKGLSHGLGGFQLSLPLGWLESGDHVVSIRLPDETVISKTLSLAQEHLPAVSLTAAAVKVRWPTVIVPVYDAVDDVATCIDRLEAYTPPHVDILLIDDASPDPRIASLLDRAAKRPNVRTLRNRVNQGFTRTINRGLTEAGRNDVIILNSDARVTPGWIEGMTFAARVEPRIATVTAMSDRAGAFSAPHIGNDNPLPAHVDEIAYARAFRRQSLGLYPKVPTGNGFCMYISRACIEEIGPFDAEAFPRGYGEENDFCMRALRAGWRHVIDDRTYVFHERSKSFGGAKTELMAAGRRIVDARYPEYGKAIRVFAEGEKILLARLRAQQALSLCRKERAPALRVLFVISTQTGGTPQTNRDLMTGLGDAVDGWIMHCDSKVLELRRMIDGEDRVHRTHKLSEPVDPLTHRSMEYEAVVSAWLLELDADIVHIRHLAWHSLMLPAIVKNLGRKVVFSFHDFYALCPTVKLLDENERFCGGTCTTSAGQCRAQLWPEGSQPDLKNRWVHHWRARFAAALEPCDGFVTTSQSARQRIAEALPSIAAERFVVIPHGRDFEQCRRLRQTPAHGQPIRILVPGHIDAAKGRDVILRLLEHDRGGLLEFHVMGSFAFEGTPPAGIVSHGRYDRDSFAHLAGTIGPHMGAIFSIWDETYCHTLTELWSVGLPALVFDFPTVADRVRESGAGWVVDHADTTVLYHDILRIAFDAEEQRAKDGALAAWQAGDGARNTIRRMAADYFGLYKEVLGGTAGPLGKPAVARIGVVCPASVDLRTANASTYIRIWERTRNHPSRDPLYVRMTPQELIANLRNRSIDGAILQRTAIPPTMIESLLQSFRETGIPYIFDIDDDLLNVPADKDPTGRYASYAPKLKAVMAGAAMVTVSTQMLADHLSPLTANIAVLTNRLSDRLWLADPSPPIQDGKVRALYMGTDTHMDDLHMVLPALDQVVQADDRFELTLIGLRLPADDPILLERETWLNQMSVPPYASRYDGFVHWLQSLAGLFDFGIAPLKGTPFNACKSALKVLDYGALGLPSLVSDVEVYRSMARAAPSGVRLVGDGVEQWVEALLERIREALAGGRRHDATLRNWIIDQYMLDRSLRDFDKLVLAAIGIRSPRIARPDARPALAASESAG